MIKVGPIGLIEGIFGTSFFCWGVRQGRNSVLQKCCQKLFPSITHELLKVPLCFICQKNSHGVRITWLKGYFIVTKYEDARAWESWGRNFWTPCIMASCQVYVDNAANRRLGRVGMPLGSMVQSQSPKKTDRANDMARIWNHVQNDLVRLATNTNRTDGCH